MPYKLYEFTPPHHPAIERVRIYCPYYCIIPSNFVDRIEIIKCRSETESAGLGTLLMSDRLPITFATPATSSLPPPNYLFGQNNTLEPCTHPP